MAASVTAIILRGDAQHLPLPDASVDLIVTSPPYYSLRSYQDGGKKLAGQVGAESTWQQYIHTLLDCTEEWIRVLKPSGSLFVNLDDKYSSATGPANGSSKRSTLVGTPVRYRATRGTPMPGVRPKSLLLLPERYRIAAIDRFGLIARAVIVWSKPNGLPESVTDRVRRSHEDWVHPVKQPRYYAAVDEIREPHTVKLQRRFSPQMRDRVERPAGVPTRSGQFQIWEEPSRGGNPLGKLPGSVWSIPTVPLRVPEHVAVDHFAAFPPELPYQLILGWSPPGICTVCGTGLVPITHVEGTTPRDMLNAQGPSSRHVAGGKQGLDYAGGHDVWRTRVRTGNNRCDCTPYVDHTGSGPRREYLFDGWTQPPATPAVVLDPFGGTGTVALVASVLGRVGITVDLSQDYCRLAQWRTTDPKQRARIEQRRVRKGQSI